MTKSNHQEPGSTGSDKERLQEIGETATTDAKLDEILHRALERPTSAPMATEESIRAGAEHMRQGRLNATRTLLARIERKELIPKDEFRKLLGVSDEWIDHALAENRLFACSAPGELPYFPSFFSDRTVPLAAFEVVSEALANLPGPVKYHFFTSKSTFLQRKTPLESMRDGELRKVIMAAEGFAER